MSTKSISISGVSVEVSAPYAEGHVITAAEAKTLNQTRAENIGNNFRSAVKAALEQPEGSARNAALAKVLEDLKGYDENYVFSMTANARTPIDPIEAEAFRIAKEVVKGKITEKYGVTLKAYFATEGNEEKYEAAVEKIAAQEDTIKEAKRRVASKKKLPELGGEDLSL
jgi:hypothetical protein